MEPGRLQSVVASDDVHRPMSLQLFWSGRRPLRMFVNVTAFVLATACASPEVLRGAARPPVGQSEAETTLEGKMEVITEDSDQGSRTLYFLIVGDRRVPLRFTARPLNLITGTRVRVRGQSDPDGTLVVSAIEKL